MSKIQDDPRCVDMDSTDAAYVSFNEADDARDEEIRAIQATEAFSEDMADFEIAKIEREFNERFERRLRSMPWPKAELLRIKRQSEQMAQG